MYDLMYDHSASETEPRKAVEMTGLWKGWKANNRLSTLSTSPLEISPSAGEIPTFPQLRRRERMEKCKTKYGFPTFPPHEFPSLKPTRPRRARASPLRSVDGAALRACLRPQK